MAVRPITALIAIVTGALVLAACGEAETPDASPYAAGGHDAAERNAGEADAAAGTGAEEGSGETPEGPSELDQLTRTICETLSQADADAFAAGLPAGAGFASRAADGRVHIAWSEDGAPRTRVLRPSQMEPEARRAINAAVADFLRHNMRARDDRTGKTGAFRARDGRFCIAQTEQDVVDALRDAAMDSDGGAAPNPGD